MQLSEHFSYEEAILSETAERYGLNNNPDTDTVVTMRLVAAHMEVVRGVLRAPIRISSWYRSPAVNLAVGSKSQNSQHILGEAVDFIAPKYGTPLDICRKIIANKNMIIFDQLILEHTWVHISFCFTRKPRLQVLSLISGGKYASGLTDKTGVPYK